MGDIRVLTVTEAARRLRTSRYHVHRMLLSRQITSAWVNDNPGVLVDAAFAEHEQIGLAASAA